MIASSTSFEFVVLVAMLLSGQADAQGDDSASKAVEADLERQSDGDLVARHPGILSRKGGILVVNGQTFADLGDCDQGDCIRHRLDGVWKQAYVGIDVTHHEEQDYFLVGHNDYIPIGSRPIPSPSGRRFFTGHHDDRRWSPFQGASVWEWEPHPRRLRLVDTDLVAFHSFVAWRGDACVEFTGSRGYNVRPLYVQRFWLAEQDGDWRLFEKRPASCS